MPKKPDGADGPAAAPEPSFEQSLAEIEGVVADLEGGALDLDDALSRFERGVALLGRCRATLQAAERRVALLTGVEDDGAPRTVPFGAPIGDD